ncbi:BatD family protein [Pseudomonas sp. LJDD11]|uniref:BatD family protein n=1 Tax=Pseudomonas sp. LJDD11 TaxID=2931984 RepID=UPI00211CE95D|nr:protein BatD [Pseudomonas sp. LJDD11]MCQ9426148.1 BatD family protein [Pseudomonas sp. LJDD11]
MSRAPLLLSGLLLWMTALCSQAAELTAQVDRTRLVAGETVELTLETNDVTQFGKPDLSVLDEAFEVRDTRQVNSLTTLDGNSQANTRWLITLLPRHTGSVEIPPVQLGQSRTQPVLLQVLPGDAQEPGSELAPVFIEASLDQDSVYVQAQAVLTLRIYHSVSLFDDSSLSPLQLPEARIEKLGDSRTYEKLINGIRHGVIETRYAIYPQQSGLLKIPALVFSATQAQSPSAASPGQQQAPNPYGPQPGKALQVSSAEISLKVKARPELWPADKPWLPASSVNLEESWNPDTTTVQAGDSLTRTLTLKVEGLSASQLPPLQIPDLPGVRRYPDQPQLTNQPGERGLTGSRKESEALVPGRAASLELPAVEVTWWNTREDHIEHTSLPARTLQVSVNPGLAVDTPVSGEHGLSPWLWIWQLSTLFFACTTLLGLWLWWRARGLPAVARAAQTGPSPRTVLDDLRRACLANDPQSTRQALDAWARQQPETLADMAARFVPLSDALDGLNGALYSEAGPFWLGEELWRAIRSLPTVEHIQDSSADAGLPPLYPK